MMKQKVDDGYFANGLVQPSKTPTETRRNPQKPHKVFSWLSTIFSFAKNPVQGKCKNAVVNNTKICAFFFSSPIFAAPKPQDQQQPTTNFKSMKTPAFLFKDKTYKIIHSPRSWLWWSWVFYHLVLTWSYPLAPWGWILLWGDFWG